MNSNLLLPLMCGIDIPMPELSLTIHPPRIEEIAFMGEDRFFNAVQHICLNKEQLMQDESVLSSLTNFQIIMKVLEQSQNKDKKNTIQTLLLLMFPQYDVILLPNSFLLTRENENIHIDSQNFDTLQEYIKEILCVSNVLQQDNVIYKPANDMAKKIADKMYEGRRKVSEINQRERKQTSILTRYMSILSVSKIIDPLDAPKLTLFQIFDLMERHAALLEWDTDKQVRLAGGKPEKSVENWMRDLHQNDSYTQAFTSSMIKQNTEK